MLKLTMTASLLAITLSVDAFAAYPDEDDKTGTTTTSHRGPVNTQQTQNREPSPEQIQISFFACSSIPERLLADSQLRFDELSRQFRAELEAYRTATTIVPYEHQSLPSIDLSTLLEKKDAE